MSLIFDKYRDFKMTLVSIILVIVLILLFIIIFFYKFDFSDSYTGIVRQDGDWYVYILVSDNSITKIKNKQLVLNRKKLNFDIVSIDSEYTLTINGKMKGLYLKLELDESDKINNNILNLNFVSKKTVFDKFKEML